MLVAMTITVIAALSTSTAAVTMLVAPSGLIAPSLVATFLAMTLAPATRLRIAALLRGTLGCRDLTFGRRLRLTLLALLALRLTIAIRTATAAAAATATAAFA